MAHSISGSHASGCRTMSADEAAGIADLSKQGKGASKRKGAGSKYKEWTSESQKHGVGEQKVNGVKLVGGPGGGSKSGTVQENKYSREEEHQQKKKQQPTNSGQPPPTRSDEKQQLSAAPTESDRASHQNQQVGQKRPLENAPESTGTYSKRQNNDLSIQYRGACLRRPIRQPIAHVLSYCECDHLITPRIAHKIRRAIFLIDALTETSCTSGPIRVSCGHTTILLVVLASRALLRHARTNSSVLALLSPTRK